ncbi:exodeoxyribonuclease VII small subunit [Sinobaca qinghaiensis]|uniref:Exodeoxyribonuclease 7 small subunit n=1 Tax=Sinobaca qinghaiensis TaxID=342944 RepID=A0A419V352_9BACL|nr:exodeoxyribonuclease VII small subunit [Sinobaca qinghaiensis]RKD72957.1 exodeoxyribonuclease VII small subunit [Sinobaca qinghaiensis]
MMSENKELSFEEALKQLESTVNKLEEGDVPLEKALHMYQEGMQLSSLCHDKLKKVEKQMDVIIEENGEIKPLTVDGEDAGE